jgi:hypothetical protein
MSRQIEQRIYVGDRDAFGTIGDLHDVIAGANFSLSQNAEVKPGPVMCHEQGWHTGLVHADAHSVAGYTRLRHFKYRVTDAVAVTDTDFCVEKPLNRKVLSKLAESEIPAAQKALPIVIGIHLVDKYGAMLAAMPSQICLPIAVNVELAHHAPLVDWSFPDRRSDSLAIPVHLAWKTNVYGEQSGHNHLLLKS